MVNIGTVLRYFPLRMQKKLEEYFMQKGTSIQLLEEIRIRVGKPIFLKIGQTEQLIEYRVTPEEMLETLQQICDNSIYSYQNQICSGYVTIQGGHRVGITGNVVLKEGKVTNMNYITSLNFRIAKQMIGCSNKILKYVIQMEGNTVYPTLIVSAPGKGKTTILRDLVRRISNGVEQLAFKGINVGMVDERGEIAAMYRGIPQNDVGIRTDVLDNVSKAVGLPMLVRSMAPKVIVADEIGSKEDVQAILYAACSGVKGIFTAHGESIEEIKQNPAIGELLQNGVFERIIFLADQFEIGKVYEYHTLEKQYHIMQQRLTNVG